MENLKILVPQATTNYVKNPALRYGTTGYTAFSSTISRTLERARFGIASLKVLTSGALNNEGAYYRVTWLSSTQSQLTGSVYLRGSGQVRIRLVDNTGGHNYISETVGLNDKDWTRLSVSGLCSGGNDIRLYVETNEGALISRTFYADGFQIEPYSEATTYCDGDQEGCRWNTTVNSSISTRSGETRAGGRWVVLAGDNPSYPDVYVTALGGFGMPPVQNNIQPWSISPGSFYQNQKILNRVVTLVFTAKHTDTTTTTPIPLRYLHELREFLVDIFKTDKTLDDQAFWFEYSETGAERPLYIQFRYDAGLEGSWDVRNGWVDTFTVRLIAVDPLFSRDSYEVKQLEFQQNYTSTADMCAWYKNRETGQWNLVQNGAGLTISGIVYAVTRGADGMIYFGGAFTNVGNRIVKWDGSNFTELGAGGANNTVRAIAIGLDGSIYAGGEFTSIGGVAASRIAKYNPTTNTWSAMGTGANNTILSICAAPNGNIYAGGLFSSIGGVTINGVAYWDNLQWRAVGTVANKTGGRVSCIIDARDGRYLYFGCDWTTLNGGAGFGNVGKIDIGTNLISNLGYGLYSQVDSLVLGIDGTLYASGAFTTGGQVWFGLAADTADRLNGVARYNGGTLWMPLGSGLGNKNPITLIYNTMEVYSLSLSPHGELYAAGIFRYSGSRPVEFLAKWYGDTWSQVDVNVMSTESWNFPTCVLCAPNGDLYIGTYAGNGPTYHGTVPKTNSVTNPGSATTWPVVYISGQGHLRYIANIKTGQEIFMDLTVYNGEEVFIDFARGKIQSTSRGNLLYTLQQGSEIRSIYLIPGDNTFAVLMDRDVVATIQIGFKPMDWSADAVMTSSEV